ncbi:MAG TPA: NAD-dependent succinate-semialdehyde dehydrogenase [Candidatus Binataceae bacterium]|nr:NAD-dependent succinate-semialdehyde dehydrogenase [Candidatus Binataceae bacterium]
MEMSELSRSRSRVQLDVRLLIDGSWRHGADERALSVVDPASGQSAGQVAVAGAADLQAAVDAAIRGFAHWRRVAPFDRARILRRAAESLRGRAGEIARILTTEQGKPLGQARHEVMGSADVIEWFAEEGKRCFGQVIPGREPDSHVLTRLEPVGPVAAFTPWNFPVSQAVKKLAAALAAGCSIILKGPEEAPGACAEMVRAFAEAGLPPGAIGLLFGDPPQISSFLIAHPEIRHMTFTGSVAVGKSLAAMAASHMKRMTLELGGHAPAIVCDDADLALAVGELARMKFLNAGQVCLSPTRFLIARPLYHEFVERFCGLARELAIGAGDAPDVEMGPLANARRVQAIDALVRDAVAHGAKVACGGGSLDRPGYFYAPTVLIDVPVEARAMNEEPFGPLALIRPFDDLDEAIAEANRLPYGLASYVFTRSIANEEAVTEGLEAGMIAVNRVFSSTIEAPFGGVKDSGFGTEGGTQAIRNFLNEKMISRFVGARGTGTTRPSNATDLHTRNDNSNGGTRSG